MSERANGEPEAEPRLGHPTDGEGRLAASTAGAILCFIGAIAGTLALRQPESPDYEIAIPAAGAALLLGLLLLAAARVGRPRPPLVFAADAVAAGLVAALVYATGGDRSYYAALCVLVAFHAAAFLPTRWAVWALALAFAGFLAPLVYDGADRPFPEIAAVAAPAALVGAFAVHLALRALRGDRARLTERAEDAQRLADQDPLTGLGNYRTFWRSLQAETARARRHGEHFSLVLLDLDGFKTVNDVLGHRAGDRVLQRTARALRSALRTEDVLCRQGGDEFAVIAVQAGREEGQELTERLADSVAAAMRDDFGHVITTSAGSATFDEDATSAEELVHVADEALRASKRDRRAARALAARHDAVREGGAPRGNEPADERTVPLAPEEVAPAAAASIPTNGEPAAVSPVADPADAGRRGHLTILSGLARALAGTRDVAGVTATAVAHLAGAIDGTGAAIHRWDRAHGELELAAFSGRLPRGQSARRQPDDQGILRIAAREGRAVIVADSRDAPSPADGATLVRSELAAPVLVGSEVWGAVHVVSDDADAYGGDDLALAEAIAEQIGRALACVWVVKRLEDSTGGDIDWLAGAVTPRWDDARALAELAEAVGQRLGLAGDELDELRLSALFHDIGTIAVPTLVLAKRGRLSDDERAVVREHVIAGERVLRRVPHLRPTARIVRHSHERVDGAGYPDGLAGEQIPLASRVVLACETWLAMTSPRPYREPLPRAMALAELRRAAGSQLDPAVVEAVVAVVEG